MFARTERLLLRPSWPEDAEALHEAVSDETLVGNLATAPWPYALENAIDFISRVSTHSAQDASFLVFRRTKAAPQLIGSCGFHAHESGGIELGYWIARSHWGLGFATEAAKPVIEIAKTCGHKRIKAEHFVDNPASGNVLRKLGFRPTGRTINRHSAGRGREVAAAQFVMDFDASEMCKSGDKGDDLSDARPPLGNALTHGRSARHPTTHQLAA